MNLTLPVFVKILTLTNSALTKSSEDVDNDLSLDKPMKNTLKAGKQLFLNLYFFLFSFPYSHFLYQDGVPPVALFI